MEACVDNAQCKAFTYDEPPSQYANNCYLFSQAGNNWNENKPGWNSGFKCDDRPPVMPTGPPTTVWSTWSQTTTPPPTTGASTTATTTRVPPQPTPPPPPPCNNPRPPTTCICYGDPLVKTLDGQG